MRGTKSAKTASSAHLQQQENGTGKFLSQIFDRLWHSLGSCVLVCLLGCCCAVVVAMLLMTSGDIESNPGPSKIVLFLL